MKVKRIATFVFLTAFLLVSIIPTSGSVLAQGDGPTDQYIPEDMKWESGYHTNGVFYTGSSIHDFSDSMKTIEKTVMSVAIRPTDGLLFIGGLFDVVNGTPGINGVAYWDGANWVSLGAGVDGRVNDIKFDAEGNVYVGGNFTSAGGETARYVAKFTWATQTWSALGDDLDDAVTTLQFVNNELYAGGEFKGYFKKWNGTKWVEVTPEAPDGIVFDLEYDSTNNYLYIGGEFTSVGSLSNANYIARYDGTAWTTLATGVNSVVYSLELDPNNGSLYVGGGFGAVDGNDWGSVAKWRQTGGVWGWSQMGSNIEGNVNSLSFNPVTNDLYAGGEFTKIGSLNVDKVARWNADTSIWYALGSGEVAGVSGDQKNNINSLVWANNTLYVGGENIYRAGDAPASDVASWNGTDWSAIEPSIGSGIIGEVVNSVVIDSNHQVYVGGNFFRAGSQFNVKNLAKLDPATKTWSSVGGGIDKGGTVIALLLNGSNLYVGGYFSYVGGTWNSTTKEWENTVDANNIAVWDGTNWSAMGDGMNGDVSALLKDSLGNLYAGGSFTASGATAVNHIARWDGTAWVPLDTTLDAGINGEVKALAADGNGNLYVGGEFTSAGGVTVNNVARYSFQTKTWSALGKDTFGVNNPVKSLAVDSGGDLIAAGDFSEADGLPAAYIARYNPASNTWSALGDEDTVGAPVGYVSDLAFDPAGRLYATGKFPMLDGMSDYSVLSRWNGVSWEPQGQGSKLAKGTRQIALDPGTGDVVVVGSFQVIGGKYSNLIGIYHAGLNIPVLKSPANGEVFKTLSRVKLSWQPVVKANKYVIELYRYSDLRMVKVLTSRKPTLTLSTRTTGLIDGPFFWRVMAYRGKTPLTEWSGMWKFYLPSTPLALIRPSNSEKNVSLRPVFQWEKRIEQLILYTDNGKEDNLPVYQSNGYYEFQLAMNTRFNKPVWSARMTDTSGDFYYPQNLKPNTRYYWRVRMMDSDGQFSQWSKPYRFVTAK